MNLHEAIRCRDFELFQSLLKSGANIAQLDAHGNTVLHELARNVFSHTVNSEVMQIFKPKAQVFDWLSAIMGAVPWEKDRNTKIKFAEIQNKLMDTCMHVAINHENWEFAGLMKQNYWFGKLSTLKKNDSGLNEYELCIKLYGTRGRKQLYSLFDFYSAPKLHEEIDVEAAAKKVRDDVRDTIMTELPHLPYDNWLEDSPEFVYSFFEQFAEVLVCKNYSKNQIITTLRELSRGNPVMHSYCNYDEIIMDLKIVYNSDAFLPYSRILEKLIAKLTVLSLEMFQAGRN